MPTQFGATLPGSLTGSPGAGAFGNLLLKQLASGSGSLTPDTTALPAQFAALLGSPPGATSASAVAGTGADPVQAAALFGQLLTLLQQLLASGQVGPDTAAAEQSAGAQGQTAGITLDGAPGTGPGAAGWPSQAVADAAATAAGDGPAIGASPGTDAPDKALMARLAALWPQLLAFLQQSLATRGLQVAAATPAQAGGVSAALPGGLVVPTTAQPATVAADGAEGLALPLDAPASIRWLVDSGLLGGEVPVQTANAAVAATTQTGQVTLPDGSALTLSLTSLADGRYSVSVGDAQGQTLLTAQLTVQRMPAGTGQTAVPAAGNPVAAALASWSPGSTDLSPDLPLAIGPAAEPELASPHVFPIEDSAAATAELPAATAALKPEVPAVLTTPAGQAVVAVKTAQAAPVASGISLPELSRQAAVPVADRSVTPNVTADSAMRATTPVQPQLVAALASMTPARTVAVPVQTSGGAAPRQVALPAPPSSPTDSPELGADAPAKADPAVTTFASSSTAALLQADRTPARTTRSVLHTADSGSVTSAVALAGDVAESLANPLAAGQPGSGLSPHLFQFTLPTLPTTGPAGLDYAELSQRMLGATQSAQAQGDGLYQAKLELNPPGLGRLFASIAVHDGQVAVQLAVASAAPRKQLEAGLAGLKRSLEDAGLDVAGLRVVTLDPEQDGSGSAQQQNGSHHSGSDQQRLAQHRAADHRPSTEFMESLPAELWPLAALQAAR